MTKILTLLMAVGVVSCGESKLTPVDGAGVDQIVGIGPDGGGTASMDADATDRAAPADTSALGDLARPIGADGALDQDDSDVAGADGSTDVSPDGGPDGFSDATDGPSAIRMDAMDAMAPEAGTDVRADAPHPSCAKAFSTGEPGCILNAQLAPITSPLKANVTVVSVEDAAMDGCGGLASMSASPGASSGGGPAKRVVVKTDTQQWTLYARIADLPADFLKVDDRLDLAVEASIAQGLVPGVSQTVILSRDGHLLMFTSSFKFLASGSLLPIPVPALDAYGISVKDNGAICERRPWVIAECSLRGHQAAVTRGMLSSAVAPGETVHLGTLSFTVGSFIEVLSSGYCDAFSTTKMWGFATGP